MREQGASVPGEPPVENKEGLKVSRVTTTVVMETIETIRTIQVLESDLNQLGQTVADENQALGFLTFFAGSALGAALQWISVEKPSTDAKIFFFGTLAVSVVVAGWFGIVYVRALGRRPKLLTRIKRKKTTPESE